MRLNENTQAVNSFLSRGLLRFRRWPVRAKQPDAHGQVGEVAHESDAVDDGVA